MRRVILTATAILAILASGAQANNQIYGAHGGIAIEGEGYKLFISDKILDTVERIDNDKSKDVIAGNCTAGDENTSKHLGDIGTIRSDSRLSIAADAKISYSSACSAYYSVVARLKTADDIRKLWLLFGDSATDDFVVETLQNQGSDEELNNEISLMIESKRLTVVSKYLEFFYTKNKDWKLTDYTFLSQAFKARKGKALSPSYIRFIEALITGDAEKAYQVVRSIDIENLGIRFIPSGSSRSMKEVKDNTMSQGKK